MPKRNKDGLFEYQGGEYTYTWVYRGMRKYANWDSKHGLIVVS